MKSNGILEHGKNFSGLNFFGKIIINPGKPYTKSRSSFIALPFQGIEFCKL
jgi:hypothetical protein